MATPASPTPKQLKEIQLLALQDPDRLRSANVGGRSEHRNCVGHTAHRRWEWMQTAHGMPGEAMDVLGNRVVNENGKEGGEGGKSDCVVNNPDRKYSIMDVVFGQDAVLGYFHFVWQQMKWERKARKAEEVRVAFASFSAPVFSPCWTAPPLHCTPLSQKVAIKAAVAESLRSDAQVDPLDLARQQSLVSAGIVVGQEQGPLPPYTPAGAAPAYSP
ncbi:hypothetical protein M427DRAFT_142561 [Gonapodya prolifera JEL478]|uniref:Uncharacterized protein n=1 Tax=Gonapodya prolifera (strain JEL478) TaxID=1344416 RepID=A0A139AWG1_GONPJ|nr:hypothetical protein M427DRAFT_142561 [Gonapodya prolifera JEL478]|eukprot:KXS20805.1 hypothetical protein M427DRAFT_142561 [Gonapodya prolifera JEL478]